MQVAHNVRIGPDCVIVGQTGIAGSSELGAGVVLGGQTAVRDHIILGDGAISAARSAIAKDVPPGQTVSGMPALPHRQSLREQAALRHLPAMRDELKRLQEQLAELQKRWAPNEPRMTTNGEKRPVRAGSSDPLLFCQTGV